MDEAAKVDANLVWDERYEKGGHVGTAPVIESDPIDYTQHKFLYGHSIGKPTTGSLDGWPTDAFAREHLTDRPQRVLAIGSGMAFIEEHLLANDLVGHITAYEMSPRRRPRSAPTRLRQALCKSADNEKRGCAQGGP